MRKFYYRALRWLRYGTTCKSVTITFGPFYCGLITSKRAGTLPLTCRISQPATCIVHLSAHVIITATIWLQLWLDEEFMSSFSLLLFRAAQLSAPHGHVSEALVLDSVTLCLTNFGLYIWFTFHSVKHWRNSNLKTKWLLLAAAQLSVPLTFSFQTTFKKINTVHY